jgi:hypothetical protein
MRMGPLFLRIIKSPVFCNFLGRDGERLAADGTAIACARVHGAALARYSTAVFSTTMAPAAESS